MSAHIQFNVGRDRPDVKAGTHVVADFLYVEISVGAERMTFVANTADDLRSFGDQMHSAVEEAIHNWMTAAAPRSLLVGSEEP